MRSVQLCRITVLVSAYVSAVSSGRGDICHLNAENQGSSQVSGSSRSSGMQIGISPCRYHAGSPRYACILRAYALVAYAYLIYHFMRRYDWKDFLFLFYFRPDLMVCSIVQPSVHVATYAIYVQQSMYKYRWSVYKMMYFQYLLLSSMKYPVAMSYFPFVE